MRGRDLLVGRAVIHDGLASAGDNVGRSVTDRSAAAWRGARAKAGLARFASTHIGWEDLLAFGLAGSAVDGVGSGYLYQRWTVTGVGATSALSLPAYHNANGRTLIDDPLSLSVASPVVSAN